MTIHTFHLLVILCFGKSVLEPSGTEFIQFFLQHVAEAVVLRHLCGWYCWLS